MKKLTKATLLTTITVLGLGIAFCQYTALRQADAMTWYRTLSDAGLNQASPNQIVPYLRQRGLTQITIRGPIAGDPIPGYTVVTACIAPTLVVGPLRLGWDAPHELSLSFCNGRLYAEEIRPWIETIPPQAT